MNIKFVYYFKKNHKVFKNTLTYFQLIELLEMTNDVDKFGQSYKKANTYQLVNCRDFLLKNKELNIFKCDILYNSEHLPV